MKQRRAHSLALGLAVLFLALISFPLLGTVNRLILLGSLPLLYVYIFAIWLGLVVVLGILQARSTGSHPPTDAPERRPR